MAAKACWSTFRPACDLASRSAGWGPPCIATLGANSTASTKAAPRQACGQSTMTTPPSVSRTLSARTSVCSSVSPDAYVAQVASSSASRLMWTRDHGSIRSSPGVWASVRQPVKALAQRSAMVGAGMGAGVNASACWSRAAITCSTSSGCHGIAGCRPSTSSRTRANQGSRSTTPHSRGTDSCRATVTESNAIRTRPSCRCRSTLTGFNSRVPPLTKHRVPSAHRTRAARPGLNPLRWVLASTTGAPQMFSIAARTGLGTSPQATRRPSEDGTVTRGSLPVAGPDRQMGFRASWAPEGTGSRSTASVEVGWRAVEGAQKGGQRR